MAVNSVCVTGNLVRDCEVFATKTGSEIATFTVAVNDRVKNGDEWEDYPNYVDCKLFNASKRIPKLRKGAKVAVYGKIHQDRWEKDGKKYSKLLVYVNELEFMSQQKEEQQQSLYDSDIPF